MATESSPKRQKLKPPDESDSAENQKSVGTSLDSLPNDEFYHLLQFIPVQDKKTLREVSRRFADQVISMSPDLRRWLIDLSLDSVKTAQTFLSKSMEKGIPDLLHFKLCFKSVKSGNSDHVKLVKEWKNYTTGLLNIELSSDDLVPIALDNLMELGLNQKSCSLSVNNFMRNHCGRLEKLAISNFIRIHEADQIIAPNLDLLVLNDPVVNDNSSRIISLLNLNRNNLTKLDLNFVDLEEMHNLTLKDLELPSLKQLRFSQNCSFKLIQSNAEHLETLVFNDCSETSNRGMFLPQSLPKLTTLVSHESFNEPSTVIQKLLEAASKSLTSLVLNVTLAELEPVKMEKLVDFFCIDAYEVESDWFDQMIELNSHTIQNMYLVFVDEYDSFSLLYKIQNLKQINFICEEEEVCEMRSWDNIRKLRKRLHNVSLQFIDQNYEDFVKYFLTQKGVDSQIANVQSRWS